MVYGRPTGNRGERVRVQVASYLRTFKLDHVSRFTESREGEHAIVAPSPSPLVLMIPIYKTIRTWDKGPTNISILQLLTATDDLWSEIVGCLHPPAPKQQHSQS